MNALKEHFRVWSLYWLLGTAVVVAMIGVFWTVSTIVQAAQVNKTVASGIVLKTASGPDEAATGTVKKRMDGLLLPFARLPQFGLTLFLPAPYGKIRGVGYHESSHQRAYSLTPVGKLYKNDNAWDVDVSLDSAAPLPAYNIMESRGEYAAGTTVADIAMDPGTPVWSPVNGIVTKIEAKVIYDEYEDMQIEVVPDGHPDLIVAFLHIEGIKIKVGDHLTQGRTVMGIPHDWRGVIPSEIDDYVTPPMPHVHVQVDRPEGQ